MLPTTINPPTDNLWKFVAIAGLVGLLASFVIPLSAAWQLVRDMNNYNIELGELKEN